MSVIVSVKTRNVIPNFHHSRVTGRDGRQVEQTGDSRSAKHDGAEEDGVLGVSPGSGAESGAVWGPSRGCLGEKRMIRKLRTKRGRETYARRKAIVEPTFGQIKLARGTRQFLLQGLAKPEGEWTLIRSAHNLLKLVGSMRVATVG